MRLLPVITLLATLVSVGYGLGRTCHSNFDCSGGETCTSGTCQCASTQVSYNGRCITNSGFCTNGQQVYYNGQCYNTVTVGGQCYTSYQCLGGSSCFNNLCTCPTGTYSSNGQCQDSNGNCNSTQISYNSMCYNVANINEYCQIAAQCLGGSTCQNGVCVCPSGTTQNGQMCSTSTGMTCPNNQVSVNGVCMNRVAPGQQCQGSAQCHDGAECSTTSRLCVCAEGMFILSGFCRKLSSDDPCDQTSAVSVNNQCLQVARPGNNCQYTQQCLGGSVCLNGLCQCSNGALLVDSYCIFTGTCGTNQVMLNSRCYDLVSIGQRCSVTQQCLGNSECDYTAICSCPYGMQNVGGTCQASQSSTCPTNQVSVNGVCMNRVAPGYSCQATAQCLDQSTCVNNYCQCPTGYNLYNGYCVQSSVQGSCMQGQAYVNGQCLNLATPGGSCTNNLQCLGASTCSGTCQCSNGYTNVMNYCVSTSTPGQCSTTQVSINGQCYNTAAIGQYCLYTEQCQGGSTCQNNYCSCPSGSVQQGTICSNNCAANQVFLYGQCFYTAQIGQSCQYTAQCQGGSACTNSICQCPQGTVQQGTICSQSSGGQCGTNQVYYNGQCYYYAAIGQSCTVSAQCQGGSSCLNMVCTCPTGYYVNNGVCTSSSGSTCRSYQVNNNGVCLDTVTIGMQCQVNAQCQIVASSTCMQTTSGGATSMTCQCPSGYYYTGSSCTYSTSVSCPYSTVMVNGACLSLVQINQYCQQTAQCMGFAVCTNQVCVCPTGYSLVNSVCRSQLTKKK